MKSGKLNRTHQLFYQKRLTYSKTKNENTNKSTENLFFIMTRQSLYGYMLTVHICYRNSMLVRYSLHKLHGQGIQSYFQHFRLNWTDDLICIMLSWKREQDFSGLSCKVSKTIIRGHCIFVTKSKIIRDIFASKPKVDN